MKKLLMILPLALILCFMVGCQDKETIAELEEMKAQAEVEEQNKDLVKRYTEAWNKGNSEFYEEFYAPDYVSYFPSNRLESMSQEERIENRKMLLRAFPDLNQSIEELFAVGDRVIVRFIITGTHEGEFQGIPATGNKLEFSGIAIHRIKNGKIIEERTDMDVLGAMMQLGMELKPKEAKK
jgi:steroid delta-isomerase-like uncharacterized protein